MFTSHHLGVVRYLSAKIGVMYRGKLAEIGPAGQVRLRRRFAADGHLAACHFPLQGPVADALAAPAPAPASPRVPDLGPGAAT